MDGFPDWVSRTVEKMKSAHFHTKLEKDLSWNLEEANMETYCIPLLV